MLLIEWRMAPEGAKDFSGACSAYETTIVEPDDGVAAAVAVVQEWLGAREWEDLFGDHDGATLLIEITAPLTLAGRYRVSLDRVVEITAQPEKGTI